MKYYKVIKNNEFIGIASSENFKQYNEDSGFLLMSNEVKGQFVRVGDKLYRDEWMQVLPSKHFNYVEAQILEIEQQEYSQIEELLMAEEPQPMQEFIPVPEIVEIEIPDTINETTIEFVKEQKLKALSRDCTNTIAAGFDLEIRGINRHFSLDIYDQINIMELKALATTQNLIPYHADGEDCIYYTAEEIESIADAANKLKMYETTYYNSLKKYINSLNNIGDIVAIKYGDEIPNAYKTNILRILEN